MDYLGPFTKSRAGNRYVLVMTDYHTKWVEAAKGFVEQVVLRHGAPETITVIEDSNFVGKLVRKPSASWAQIMSPPRCTTHK